MVIDLIAEAGIARGIGSRHAPIWSVDPFGKMLSVQITRMRSCPNDTFES